MKYKIRERVRINASPKEGHRQKWTEYQVVVGRKVVARYDLREWAEEFAAKKFGTDNAAQ